MKCESTEALIKLNMRKLGNFDVKKHEIYFFWG